jgi:hypothetical protein
MKSYKTRGMRDERGGERETTAKFTFR